MNEDYANFKPLHFRINTYLKDLIGRELLTNKYVAVFELVKNSYDAGATDAWVKFISNDDHSPPTKIAILDNGSGMSRKDIEDKWMNVAKSSKRDTLDEIERGDLKLSKIPVGRKGIGRFSCDKLGETLDLYTRTSGTSSWNHLIADWKKFQDAPDKDFQEIPVVIREEKKTPSLAAGIESGTLLVIGGLREQWDYQGVLRLKRHFQKLLDPVSPAGLGRFKVTIDAPFLRTEEESIAKKRPADVVNGLVRSTLFQDLEGVATKISVSLKDGILTTILLDRGVQLYKLNERVEGLKFITSIEADVFYLDQAAKGKFTRTVGIAPVNYGNVFLYRNGVRVFPYGEPNDDWLGLNMRKQQGYRRFLSSRELFGRVAVTDIRGVWEEASSRDSGIKDGDARDELVKFVRDKVVLRLENYVVKSSEWQLPSSKEEKAERNAKVIEFLAGMATSDKNVLSVEYADSLTEAVREKGAYESLEFIEDLSKDLDPEKRKALGRYLSAFRESLKEIESEAAAAEDDAVFMRTASQYVKTGTLRLIAEHNLNIIARRLEPALLDIGKYAKENNLSHNLLDKIEDAVKELQLLKERNKLVLKARWDVSRKEETNIPSYIEQYVREFWPKSLDRRGISLQIEVGDINYRREIFPETISLVVDNIIDNCTKVNPLLIKITARINQDGKLAIRFTDDGKGISDREASNLFRPWSSSTAGSGIGLYIVKKILNEIGGSIKFVGNACEKGMSGACFEVTL
jgi:signal transduction histidine kinase